MREAIRYLWDEWRAQMPKYDVLKGLRIEPV